MSKTRKKAINKFKNMNYSEFTSSKNIAKMLKRILEEVNIFIGDILIDNFDEDTTKNLYSKVIISNTSDNVNFELFNKSTNTIVIYDMPILEFLKYCVSNTLEVLMNDKIIKMVKKSKAYKKEVITRKIYLEHSI